MAYAVDIARRPRDALFDLRGPAREVAEVLAELGCAVPEAPNTARASARMTVFWIGARRWLLRAPLEREAALAARLARRGADPGLSFVLVSDHYAGFDVGGREAAEIMAQGTPLDLDARAFPPDGASFTEFFGLSALVARAPEASFAVYVERSFADYLEAWLRTAAGAPERPTPGR